MRVYHFIGLQHGIEAITEGRIKISRLNSLNDPFEFLQFQTNNYLVNLVQKNRKTETNKHYGVICFTASHKNPVLWAHYASNHNGLCLGFDVPDEKLIKIQYVKEREPEQKFRDALDLDSSEFLRYMLSKKNIHWAYEQELRMLHKFNRKVKHDELCFVEFNAELQLKEVLVGIRANSSRKTLSKIIKTSCPGVELFNVSPCPEQFELIVQRRV